MSCYNPLKAYRTASGVVFTELKRHDIIGDIQLPCGMCIGCRMRRGEDWTLRVMHESTLWPANCFVTLTYQRGNLPPNSSLCHRDFQLFLKRTRKHFKQRVRFYMCGEYGELHQRPHYHAVLFNCDFSDRVPAGTSASGELYYTSETLTKLWGQGRASVQDLTRETAGYCARYIMKKQLGESAKTAYDSLDTETGEIIKRNPVYAAMSLKPGIGAGWYEKYKDDVHKHDFAVSNGRKLPTPRYYDKLLKRKDGEHLEDLKYQRELNARQHHRNNTTERLKVREEVHEAKVKSLARTLE